MWASVSVCVFRVYVCLWERVCAPSPSPSCPQRSFRNTDPLGLLSSAAVKVMHHLEEEMLPLVAVLEMILLLSPFVCLFTFSCSPSLSLSLSEKWQSQFSLILSFPFTSFFSYFLLKIILSGFVLCCTFSFPFLPSFMCFSLLSIHRSLLARVSLPLPPNPTALTEHRALP